MSKRMSIAFALLIGVMWTLSTILDAVSKSYEPRPEIGPLMLAVGAYAFANGTIGRIIRRDEHDG